MKLQKNIHRPGRAGRVAVGLAGVALVLVWPRTPWGLLGLYALATGLLGYAPLFRVMGISGSTRRPPDKSADQSLSPPLPARAGVAGAWSP